MWGWSKSIHWITVVYLCVRRAVWILVNKVFKCNDYVNFGKSGLWCISKQLYCRKIPYSAKLDPQGITKPKSVHYHDCINCELSIRYTQWHGCIITPYISSGFIETLHVTPAKWNLLMWSLIYDLTVGLNWDGSVWRPVASGYTWVWQFTRHVSIMPV